jgi:hypothetical protein
VKLCVCGGGTLKSIVVPLVYGQIGAGFEIR